VRHPPLAARPPTVSQRNYLRVSPLRARCTRADKTRHSVAPRATRVDKTRHSVAPRATRVDKTRHSVASSGHTCGHDAPQRGPLGPHVWTRRATARPPRATCADTTRHSVAPSGHMCGQDAPQRGPLGPHVRTRRATAWPRCESTESTLTLTSGLNGPMLSLRSRRSQDLRFWRLSAVQACWIAHSPVPVRELSLLLLPRTLGVRTHLGKHQPEVSARCRNFQPVAASHLSTSRDVPSGLTARMRRLCHE
jgi:hypothetical protein